MFWVGLWFVYGFSRVSFPGVVVVSSRCMVDIVMVAGIVGRGCCFLEWFVRGCSGGGFDCLFGLRWFVLICCCVCCLSYCDFVFYVYVIVSCCVLWFLLVV